MKRFFEFHGSATGSENMAADLALIDKLRSSNEPAVGRTYMWKPWAVSLGKHQPESTINLAEARRRGFDVVHRPTGGRAVLHAEELTYCIAARGTPQHVYAAVHAAILSSLRYVLGEQGNSIVFNQVPTDLRTHYASESNLGQACFSSSARFELMASGRKVVGSAQRIIDGIVLQHGSILCGDAHLILADVVAIPDESRTTLQSALRSSSISLSEIAGRNIEPESIAMAMEEAVVSL